MAVTAVTGSTFTVTVASVVYTDQVTDGMITQTGTTVRTKTLGGHAFNIVDATSSASIGFLYDGDSGLYNALSDAVTGQNAVALLVTGSTGTFTMTLAYVDSVDLSYDATGVATCKASFQGDMVLS
jgi:hypothetical protein